MEKIITLQNLLTQIRIIQKKYDDIAEVTGEHFNVFDVLGLNSDELSHSAIIANLLNAKGKHGQKDLFLKLFIQVVREKYNLTNYLGEDKIDFKKMEVLGLINTMNSETNVEKHVGKVDYETAEGGRIDIIVTEGGSNIIIENKIYATDQPQQLVRYYKYDKNAPIFYLTLFGEPPHKNSYESSDVKLCNNKDFFLLSYKDDIKNWLELCVKAVYNKPFIRETISQYIILLKKLTNQNLKKKMNKEILKLVNTQNENDFDAYIALVNVRNDLRKDIVNEVKDRMKATAEKYNLYIDPNSKHYNNLNKGEQYSGFRFTNETLENLNLRITFSFQGKDHKKLLYGFSYIDKDSKNMPSSEVKREIQKQFNAFENKVRSSSSFLCFADYTEYEDWNNLYTLKKIKFGGFIEDFEKKLKVMSTIVNDLEK